ncbi:cyclic nucleotide-binding protein [Candidatus Moduliflexus flocculans]|uniref:Cyclic nucleotide-binding protein n=1 Tax=Candidatus Moduliflexus flocculans TaxID=1499966 RepID=A0A081BL81_9BACT|nr:cyclic nucleotide-binding protein [Candidatus Moduliflexus flocculans]
MSSIITTPPTEVIHQETLRYQALLSQESGITERTIPIHLTLGKLYEHAGEKQAAIQEFAAVAIYYADHGQFVKAIAAAQMIVKVDPDNEEILDRLRELYFMRRAVSDDQLEDYHESVKHIDALQEQQETVEETPRDEDVQEISDVVQLLKQVPLFEKVSVSELRGIHLNSTLRTYAANEIILEHGNLQRSLFVILQGSVKIFGKDKERRPMHLATLETGNSFGEFALFGKIDQNLSVIAERPCALLEISKEIVLKLARTRPQITQYLKDLFKQRILDTALARVPLFSQLAPQDRKVVVARFTPVKAKKGVTIMREGTPGDCMYFLVSGKVGVFTSLLDADETGAVELPDEPLLLATLKSGDFFGEQAIVNDEPRSATIIALEDVGLLRLMKRDLGEVIQQHPWIESALQIEAYENRLKKNIKILDTLVQK